VSSILEDTKKVLGIETPYDVFDTDILMHINSVFSTLNQLGLGPDEGFEVAADTEWADFLEDDARFSNVKTYVYLRVRLLFDPPATSFHIGAIEKQIEELAYRINAAREDRDWSPALDEPVPVILDGGEI
jgi:hypothetical protein